MKRGIELVKEFSDKFKAKVNTQPSLLTEDEFSLRHSLMKEENDEYLKACEEGNLEGIADALGDKAYILFGTILAHGMQDIIEDVFVEIHKSNMSKLDKDGNPIINGENGIYDISKPMGKILKGDNFKSPDIDGILDAYFSKLITEKLMDEELKAHIEKNIESRESLLRDAIKDRLSKEDYKKFVKFEQLADYFKDKVVVMQQRATYDLTKFGVKVDGEEVWFNEKAEGAY